MNKLIVFGGVAVIGAGGWYLYEIQKTAKIKKTLLATSFVKERGDFNEKNVKVKKLWFSDVGEYIALYMYADGEFEDFAVYKKGKWYGESGPLTGMTDATLILGPGL